jgi:8-oxo-dGTP pyrophosphatase MutT (NUDIX family)
MSPVRAAATVILTRGGSSDSAEILFVCRRQSLAFLGGAHVFPGGKLDAADCDEPSRAELEPAAIASAAAALEPTAGCVLSPLEAFGLHLAAIRELFEEVGILLVEPAAGAAEIASLSAALGRGTPFLAALRAAGCKPAVSALRYVAHWITPSAEPKRFDTRFFLAALPQGQEAHCDLRESTGLVWLKPREALAKNREREIVLPPPTLRIVERLATAEVWPCLRDRNSDLRVAALLPKAKLGGDFPYEVLLPWDGDYETTPGEGLPVSAIPLLAAGPSRIVLDEGRWLSREASREG